MYLLDTNVLSELMRLQPNPRVEARFESESDPLFTSAVCVEEIRYGSIDRLLMPLPMRSLCARFTCASSTVPSMRRHRVEEHSLVNAAGAENVDIVEHAKGDLVALAGANQ